jgi:hypothetical protein
MSSLQSVEIKAQLSALRMKAALLRLRSKANFNPNQPRIPAGNPDGGEWTDAAGAAGIGSAGGSESGTRVQQIIADRSGDQPWSPHIVIERPDASTASRIVTNRNGSTVVANYPSFGVEHDLVTLPDGAQLNFENDFSRQTIRDAAGNILSDAVWTPNGPFSSTVLAQPAFFDPRKLNPRKIVFGTLLDAGIELYNWWMSSKEPGEGVVLGFNAGEYEPGNPRNEPPVYVGKRSREEVEEACEKLPTVQAMTDQAAANLPKTMFKTASARGTAIHLAVKRMVNGGDGPPADPNFRAETSISSSTGLAPGELVPYGTSGSIRVDVLERRSDDVVCAYDLKTGRSRMTRGRAIEIVGTVASVYPLARRILITEVRQTE